jgi:hypothetical protein
VIVSRGESFDAVGGASLRRFRDAWVLSTETDPRVETEPDIALAAPGAPDEGALAASDADSRPTSQLRGLHAKLFIADAGRSGRVWAGSANATDAAFHENVEFVVELEGRKDRCGIEAFLGPRDDGVSFLDLLEPYRPLSDDAAEPTPAELLELRLEEIRRYVAAFRFHAAVEPLDGEQYGLSLRGEQDPASSAAPALDGLLVRCRPLTLSLAQAEPIPLASGRVEASFGRVSFSAITSFFAFQLEGEVDGQRT